MLFIDQITQKWRQLSKQWHPDKFQDEEEKSIAQQKFMDIKEAYDKLSVIHSKRKRQNARSRKMDQESDYNNNEYDMHSEEEEESSSSSYHSDL